MEEKKEEENVSEMKEETVKEPEPKPEPEPDPTPQPEPVPEPITKTEKPGDITNYWKIAAIGIGILLIISFYFNMSDSCPTSVTGAVSLDTATEKAMGIINTKLLQPGMEATLVDSAAESGMYKLTLSINDNEVEGYISPDAKLFFTSALNLDEVPDATDTTEPAPADVPKSDKPVVELFVMSYCPYGTQAEKGMIPAIAQLGDSVDFKLRFVNYAMHGEKEVKENLNQYCIQKEEPSKLIPYLKCFLDAGDGAKCLTEAGIDTAKLEPCKTAVDEEFSITANLEDKASWRGGQFPQFNTDDDLNVKYGIQGSPGLVINGVKVNSGRAPADYLSIICNAFNEEPEACSAELSATAYQPSFGYKLADSDAAAVAQCG